MNNEKLITETVASWKANTLSATQAMEIISMALDGAQGISVDWKGSFSGDGIQKDVLASWAKSLAGSGIIEKYFPNLKPVDVKLEKNPKDEAVWKKILHTKSQHHGKEAYALRLSGLPWVDVAMKAGKSSPAAATMAAKAYALKMNLEWPVKI